MRLHAVVSIALAASAALPAAERLARTRRGSPEVAKSSRGLQRGRAASRHPLASPRRLRSRPSRRAAFSPDERRAPALARAHRRAAGRGGEARVLPVPGHSAGDSLHRGHRGAAPRHHPAQPGPSRCSGCRWPGRRSSAAAIPGTARAPSTGSRLARGRRLLCGGRSARALESGRPRARARLAGRRVLTRRGRRGSTGSFAPPRARRGFAGTSFEETTA